MVISSTSIILLFLMGGQIGINLCQADIDMSKYQRMPPLYLADDYHQCLRHNSAAAYCVVYAEIQPEPQSTLWQQIGEFYKNDTMTRYHHDELYRGVCTSRCTNYPKSMPQWNVSNVQPSSDNVRMANNLHALSRSQPSIVEYEQQLHQCVNDEIREKYNLSVKTFVKYCDNPKEPIENDSRYSLGILVILAIIGINVLSSIYDLFLKSQLNAQETLDYYDRKHKSSVDYYLTSFSLYRNFRKLVKANDSAIGKDLAFMDGFRTIMSIIIVHEHIPSFQYFPNKNPEFIENFYASTLGYFVVHLIPCIELFFFMTGLMLYVKFSKSDYITPQSSWLECAKVYGRMMISRYFRYMPSLLLLIFFTNNVLLHTGQGPFWRHLIEPNVMMCRNEWKTNLFMSLQDPNSNCWFHTWYIHTDFKLYGIFLAVLVITTKCPQYKKLIYTAVGIFGVTIPSLMVYNLKLNSVSTFQLEDFRHIYLRNILPKMSVYIQPNCNLNGAFVGILCGELYMKYLKHDKYKKIFGRYLHSAPIIGWSIMFLVWCLGVKIIYTETTVWTSLFAIPHRHLGVAIVATVVIVRGMCTGGGFLAWPIFRLLSRVSYQVYLWHLIVIFKIGASALTVFEFSKLISAAVPLYIYTISAIMATVIATMVEYPIAEILSLLDLKSKPRSITNSKLN